MLHDFPVSKLPPNGLKRVGTIVTVHPKLLPFLIVTNEAPVACLLKTAAEKALRLVKLTRCNSAKGSNIR